MEKREEFLGHPKGLYVLFFTELWERFSYYGMRAILVVFMYFSIEDGGLGWTKSDALWLYGWYTMLVYVMSIPGGILADKFLGQKKTVMLGGLLLCLGHGVLAIHGLWAFYTGLGLIVMGVGCLKPNISTMVGGLYAEGDPRRDNGFTIFYIGINVGAFLAAIIVGGVGQAYGWHAGFGLAGIGMVIGQAVYIWGQRYLHGVGDFIASSGNANSAAMNRPLTQIEKDRVVVLLISFLIIIVFWGAFEQAGGLLNIYAFEKIDLSLGSLGSFPATWFQSVNAAFIVLFGTAVAAYWTKRKLAGKEVSSLFKMGVGTIIMGLGFLLMAGASLETSSVPYGKAAMIWLFGAYFLHTIGELCASPVALSFITKLAPVKYASIMMGIYFAATGFGNKLAGTIGEASQSEAITIELVAPPAQLAGFKVTEELNGSTDLASLVNEDSKFAIRAKIIEDSEGNIQLLNYENDNDKNVMPWIKLSPEAQKVFKETLEMGAEEEKLHATIRLEKDVEAKKVKANKGDGKNYSGTLEVVEVQNNREFKTFLFITALTVIFGLLIILFLKKLKALTHGAEDDAATPDNSEEKLTIDMH